MRNLLRFFIIVMMLLFVNTSYSQNSNISLNQKHKADSIINCLKIASLDTVKTKLLFELGNLYIYNLPDTALYYYKIALTLANNKKQIANCLFNIGYTYYLKGSYNESIDYTIKAQNIFLKIDNKQSVAKSYTNLGIVYYNLGLYKKAYENHLMSLKYFKEIKNKLGEAMCYGNIANIYVVQKLYDQAISFNIRALNVYDKLKNKKEISNSYINIGVIFFKKNDFKEAIKYYKKALNISIEISDIKNQAICYNNIGVSYKFMGEFSKALSYTQQSLILKLKIGDKNGLSNTYNGIALLYQKLKDYLKVIDNANLALNIAKETGSLPVQKDAYAILSYAYDSLYNYKKSLEYYKLFQEINDSIYDTENSKQIAEMQTKYETEIKENEIILLNKENELKDSDIQKQKLIRYFMLGGFIFLLLIIFVVYNRYKVKSKLKHEKQLVVLENKALRSQMNPHFIFNCLSVIQGIIYKKENETAVKYLSHFSDLTRQILEYSRLEYIVLQVEITMISNYLELQSLRFPEKFTWKINQEGIDENEEIMIPPMLAQPFIENAIQHGFVNIFASGLIEISYKVENNILYYTIVDNGIGRKKSDELKKQTKSVKSKKHISIATSIVEERIKNINSTLPKNNQLSISIIDLYDEAGNAKGTKVILSIPITD